MHRQRNEHDIARGTTVSTISVALKLPNKSSGFVNHVKDFV
jgi:hypothetical protein